MNRPVHHPRSAHPPAQLVGLLLLAGLAWASGDQAAGAQQDTSGTPVQPNSVATQSCPVALQSPALGRIADRVARNLVGQITSFKTRAALVLIRQQFVSAARLELPPGEYTANKAEIDGIDRAVVFACFPKLAAVLAQASDANAAVSNPVYDSGDRGAIARAEQAERRRVNEAARQAREAELQRRSDAIDAAVAARAEQAQLKQAEEANRERQERERLADERRRRLEETQAQEEAEAQTAREQAAERDAEFARRRQAAEAQRAADMARQADALREQQAALAKEQADAAARSRLEDEARKVAQERDRLAAERAAAEQAAERLKRPECREADRIAQEEAVTPGADALPKVLNIVQKLQAGMRVEACADARKIFTAAERVRSATARCAPAEAVPFNDLAASMRNLILEQGC